jgi:hypothetical protein
VRSAVGQREWAVAAWGTVPRQVTARSKTYLWVTNRARDVGGLRCLDVTKAGCPPSALRTLETDATSLEHLLSKVIKVSTTSAPRHARVRSAAGKWSAWRRLSVEGQIHVVGAFMLGHPFEPIY